MFEHLKDQEGLPWKQRVGIVLVACVLVFGVFAASLWAIAKTVNFFTMDRSNSPVAVHYDADEDGAILNEILEEVDRASADQEGQETEPLPP